MEKKNIVLIVGGVIGVVVLALLLLYGKKWLYNVNVNYLINIYNSQNIPTPAPFQQDIAICNGNPNLGNNFAYVDNPTLFNEINSTGSNVYFFTNLSNPENSLLSSWFEGQLNYNGVTCDVWWVYIPSGIGANSNLTIYMHVGPQDTNYYQQYYPYVGVSAYWYCYSEGYPNMASCPNYGIYDNGKQVFNFYDNFAGTSLNYYEWGGDEGAYSVFSTDNELIIDSNSPEFYFIYIDTGENQTAYAYVSKFVESGSKPGPFSIGFYTYNFKGIDKTYFNAPGIYSVTENEEYNTSLIFGYNTFLIDTDGYTGYSIINYVFLINTPPNNVMPSIYISSS